MRHHGAVGTSRQPPENQPDAIWVGPVGPIPVFHSDDFRLEADRRAGEAAAAVADALHTPDELLAGLRHQSRGSMAGRTSTRCPGAQRCQDRPGTPQSLGGNPSWKVRDQVDMSLTGFVEPRVVKALRLALNDENEEVRWAAEYALAQLGATEHGDA